MKRCPSTCEVSMLPISAIALYILSATVMLGLGYWLIVRLL